VASLKEEIRPVLSIHRADGGHDTNYADATAAFDFVFERLGSDR